MVRTVSDTADMASVEHWARTRLEADGLAPQLREVLTGLADVLADQRNMQYECFLTVVIRTQGRREEQLQDALLCLNAQTDQDFNVLFMLHDVDTKKAATVRDMVDAYPTGFSERVRLVPVDGGSRTRPLTESVKHATGEYVVFYDDDDLLLADWVESFRRGAMQGPGKVVRANVAVQINRAELQTDGTMGQRTIGPAHSNYTKTFELVEHIERSYSPFMGIAYPMTFFTQWGERFDELLPVCEDWDLLLRATSLLGVVSVPELTAIYRLWENVETSYAGHSDDVWDEAKKRLQNRLDSSPYLMPVGSLSAMLDLAHEETPEKESLRQALRQSEDVRNAMESSTSWRLTAPLRRVITSVRKVRSRR